jgi:hypothetical protein
MSESMGKIPHSEKVFLSQLFFAHLLAPNQKRTLAEKDQDYYASMCEITVNVVVQLSTVK